MAAVRLGLIYGCVMFVAGFFAGAVRTFVLVPRTGEIAAALIELPVMLALAWFVARALVRGRAGAQGVGPAVLMGAVALAVLWALELLMVLFLFGVPLAEAPAAFLTPGGRIGVAGQIVMALFPAILVRRRASGSG